jgi:hypothetical protein
MTEPAVVIEIARDDRSSPLAATLVTACTEALPAGPCALSGEAMPRADAAPAIAIVSWSADRRVARIEVARRGGGTSWVTRTVEFQIEDAPQERWRAVGLIVATLVGEAARAAAVAEKKRAVADLRTKAPATPGERRVATRKPAWIRHDVGWIDATARAGPAFDDGSWRIGAGLRGSFAPLEPPVFATAALEYATRPGRDAAVTARWFAMSAGFGLTISLDPAVVLGARLELLGENLHGEAIDEASGISDAGDRWLAGARAGADIAWMPRQWAGVVLGAEAWALRSGAQVLIGGEPVLRERPLGFALSLGARFAFR